MWEKEQEKRLTNSGNFVESGDIRYSHPGFIGNDYKSGNAHQIELHRNYNGSGKTAFGCSDEWPVLTAKFAFPSGQESRRDELAARLMALADEFFA